MGPWTGAALSKLRSPRDPFLGSTPPAGAQPRQDGVTRGTWDHTRSQDQEAHRSQEGRGRALASKASAGCVPVRGHPVGGAGPQAFGRASTWAVARGASVSSAHVGLHCPRDQGWVTGSEPRSPLWKWGEPFLCQGWF